MDWNNNDVNKELEKLQSQLQEKLNLGQHRLSQAGDDPDKLGAALISYHGALEDHIRASLVAVVPEEIRQQVLDKSTTNWKNLLTYSKQYLGLSQEYADLINEANRYRLEIAHGGTFKWEKNRLFSYAKFVDKWCLGEIRPVSSKSNWQISSSKPSSTSTPETRKVADYEPYSSPWYRSSCFLWLTFLFFNPLWALLILTDKYQSGVLKFFVGLFYSGVIILYLWALGNQGKVPHYQSTYQNSVSNSTNETVDPDILQKNPKAIKTITCSVIWEKYSDSSKLVNKNRSMVWDEIVSYLVVGSGMTPREFFDEVVERNPSLAIDGYVFRSGKEYLLPICK